MEKVVIGDATLYCGDCMDILPTLGKVDAVITDPPYGIGADKKNAHSSIRDSDQWDNKEWDERRPSSEVFIAMLAAGHKHAIWGGNYFADLLPASSGWLSWRKPQAETGFSLADMELCWTSEGFAARCKTMMRRDGNLHPTQKPLEVMAWTIECIKATGTILDPFMGSGTTGVAAVQLGRAFIGIERDPNYFAIACDRISRAHAQGKLFEPEPIKQEQGALL